MAKHRPEALPTLVTTPERTGSFIVWMDHETAYICDWAAPLEHGCRVVITENGFAWGEGVLKTKCPKRAKELAVELDGSANRAYRFSHDMVVRIVGEYRALHSSGQLPDEKGILSTPHLHRKRLVGDGAPFPSGGVVPCSPWPS